MPQLFYWKIGAGNNYCIKAKYKTSQRGYYGPLKKLVLIHTQSVWVKGVRYEKTCSIGGPLTPNGGIVYFH